MKTCLLFSLLLTANIALASENSSSTQIIVDKTEKFIRAGNYEISGGFSVSSTKQSDSLRFYPSVGYFVKDRVVFGGAITFDYTFGKDGAADSRNVGIGPYFALYFMEHENWIGAFTQELAITNLGQSESNAWASSYIGAKYFAAANIALSFDAGMTYKITPIDIKNSTLKILGRYSVYF